MCGVFNSRKHLSCCPFYIQTWFLENIDCDELFMSLNLLHAGIICSLLPTHVRRSILWILPGENQARDLMTGRWGMLLRVFIWTGVIMGQDSWNLQGFPAANAGYDITTRLLRENGIHSNGERCLAVGTELYTLPLHDMHLCGLLFPYPWLKW